MSCPLYRGHHCRLVIYQVRAAFAEHLLAILIRLDNMTLFPDISAQSQEGFQGTSVTVGYQNLHHECIQTRPLILDVLVVNLILPLHGCHLVVYIGGGERRDHI